MRARITRREWAAALGATAAVAQAQAPPATAPPVAGLIAEARSEVQSDIEQIGKFPLAASAEPAFIFKP